MPKVSSIQDVLEAVDDAPIYAFKGVLKSFTKFYPADPAKPDSQSFQLATLAQDGKELTAKFRNRPELPLAWKGKSICILSTHTDKGWFGSKAKDDEYKGAKNRVLSVTAAAEVVLDAGTTIETPPHAQNAPQRATGPKSNASYEYLPVEDEENGDSANSATPEADKMSKAISEEEAIKAARRLSAQVRNAVRIASRTAEQCSEDYFEDYGKHFTPEEMRVTRSSIFLRFKDTGVLSYLPATPMKFTPIKPEPPPEITKDPAVPF